MPQMQLPPVAPPLSLSPAQDHLPGVPTLQSMSTHQ